MEENNEQYQYGNFGDAQTTCIHLDSCTGIVGDEEHGFRITTGFPRKSSRGMLWLKECKLSCEIVATDESVAGASLFARRCFHSDSKNWNKDSIQDLINVKWSTWGTWGDCTQSCGHNGVQTRLRSCMGVVTMEKTTCNITDQEFRGCNSQVNCMKSVEDIYGIRGPEGFVTATSTRIYQTCIHLEVTERLPCGNQAVVTRNKCDQYKCCYQEDWERVGGPKCFQTQSFIGFIGRLGWAIWGTWSSCTATCGNGRRTRSRMCMGSAIGSLICPDSDRQIQVCGTGTCPCQSMPCLNGGACIPKENVLYGYECLCKKGFAGRNCLYGEPDLKCGDDSITVQFHEGLVVDDGLIPDEDLIHFSRTESKFCFAQKQKETIFLSLPPPIDRSCGSEIYISDDQLTITNKVLWKLSDGFFDSTVVLVDISCVYNKNINSSVGLGFGIQPVLRTISEKRVVKAFDAKMFLYRDDTFLPSHRFRATPKLAQGELLYASIDLGKIKISQFSSITIKADDCWVVDAVDGVSIVQQLLKDGCPTNDVFVSIIENGGTHQVRLAIRVFDWKTRQENSNEVYFQCRVRACTEECRTRCGNSTSSYSSDRKKSQLPLTPSLRRRRHIPEQTRRYSSVSLQEKVIIL